MNDFNSYLKSVGEIGSVEQTTTATLYVSGLPRVKPGEVVIFESGQLGQVMYINKDLVEILIFSKQAIRPGTKVVRTNHVLQIPVGEELLGKAIDPLGNSIEIAKPVKRPSKFAPIIKTPGGIKTRKGVNKQLETGVLTVDLILPLGFGQRELVIGDRKTGKTIFLLQAVLTQAKQGSICIYAAIGNKKAHIKSLQEFFKAQGIEKRVVIVATGSDDPAGLIFLTPYSAMTIAEYFRDYGNNVLLILDDLSTHAKFYREISLLSKRFPGRNSYPGDIFYTHASLLERAGNFITDKGEKAITALPVAETIQGDLSGYIQTNLMSMTDGHLFFDSDMFAKGRRPAINPFLSVTRVGRQTQSKTQREIGREILIFLTLYEKMLHYSHFGAELSESTKVTLAVGEKLIRLFGQSPGTIIPVNLQIILFCFLWNRAMQDQGSMFEHKDLDKAIKAYQKNADVRSEIDNIVKTSTSFNSLLGVLKQKGDKIVAAFNKYG